MKQPYTFRQRGFVLITSLIFLLVLSLLAVMSVRGSLFEERMASNDVDMSMAREYAELALRDAERDILGLRFDGAYCAEVACTRLRPAGTRPADAAYAGSFWIAANEALADLALVDGGRTLGLRQQGVYSVRSATECGMPVWSGADWNDGVARSCAGTINASVPTIAYGTFTDAVFNGPNGVPPPRYLIELFTADDLGIADANKLFFRITAVGFGRSIGPLGRTSVTLQSVFSPQ